LVGGLYQSTAQTVTDGDVAPLEIDVNGNLRVTLATQLDSTNDSITAVLSATDNAVLDAIALGYATEGDALGDGVLIQGDDGTDRTNVLVDTDGHLQVDVMNTSIAVTNTDITSIKTAVEIMDDWDDSNYCNVNLNIAGTDVSANAGTLT
jgi:hypothetical protein